MMKGKLLIRKARESDISVIAASMRETDRVEVAASCGLSPERALRVSFDMATEVYTLEHQGLPVAMGGVTAISWLSCDASVWYLATDQARQVEFTLQKAVRQLIHKWLQQYPVLHNYILAENEVYLRWIRRLGAEVFPPKPYGPDGKPFCYFEIRRDG